jgi:hypothetical protein
MGQFGFSLFMTQRWMPAFAGMTALDSTRWSAGVVIPAQAGIQQAFLGSGTVPRLRALRLGGRFQI